MNHAEGHRLSRRVHGRALSGQALGERRDESTRGGVERAGKSIMVATIGQASSAEFYLERQRSYRHPNEYVRGGEEPDGVWWNPSGLFGLADGGRVDSRDFFRVHGGMAPDGSGKLTRNAGNEKRSPGLDLAFNADKTVSALWAIVDEGRRTDVGEAHRDAARTALTDIIGRYCGVTRVKEGEGNSLVATAEILAAVFQQGTSREGDPQLYSHCVIFNVVRTRRDGRYRSLHQKPAYFWKMAAGAAYRNALAWNLRTRLGVRMEQYGPDGAFTRIAGMPEALVAHWSKRRKTIARSIGTESFYKVARRNEALGGRERHERWRGECEAFVDPEALVGSVIGREVGRPPDTPLERASCTDVVLARLAARSEGVRQCEVVQAVENATAGLLDRAATADILARVLQTGVVVRPGRVEMGNERRVWRQR